MKSLPWRECGWSVLFVVLLIGLYGGTYWIMLTTNSRDQRLDIETWDDGCGRLIVVPDYRFGGEWSETVFTPAHMVDRAIRPTFWVDPTPMPIIPHAAFAEHLRALVADREAAATRPAP